MRFLLFVLMILATFLFPDISLAQCQNGRCRVTVTPSRSKVVIRQRSGPVVSRQKVVVKSRSAQEIAQIKVQHMARYRAKRHVLRHLGFGGGSFEGCGWASHTPDAPTCTPRRRATLVADATARGPDGWYRVRIWK